MPYTTHGHEAEHGPLATRPPLVARCGGPGLCTDCAREAAPNSPVAAVPEKPTVRSASYLSPPDFHRLDWACVPVRRAFGTPPYLVGSCLTRPDFRDIDLRLILDDEVVEHMFGVRGEHFQGDAGRVRLLLNIALSDLITKAASPPAPIDFQIQSMSEANGEYGGQMRNPMGVR